MTADTDRPQDVGRRHARKGSPSPETASLLAEYQAAMRGELRAVLGELRPVAPDPGLGLVETPPKRPEIADRMRLWDLAIKLGRELGTEIDTGPVVDPGPTPRPRRRKVDYGGE